MVAEALNLDTSNFHLSGKEIGNEYKEGGGMEMDKSKESGKEKNRFKSSSKAL
jgi:hypothetical protein